MITLYTIDCPKCRILERKLKDNGAKYVVVKDRQVMVEKGFIDLPVLEVDGTLMGFAEAMEYIKDNLR